MAAARAPSRRSSVVSGRKMECTWKKNSTNAEISKTFWDRGTLYALRGTFIAGATERSLEKLQQFSRKRLLCDRVPYVVEASPEGNMAHLSAESALYCRIFTEGLFGINPTGLRSFEFTPRLPSGWGAMALRSVKAFGGCFDIEVKRAGDTFGVRIFNEEEEFSSEIILPGASISIDLGKDPEP
mmetsp:Transcript_21144/g.52088  ORF Transcript_21144/g.52088 Transcript_21144/m.52088 type:complete len:184 (+) Transcript_21144:190-741(+)